MNSFNVNKSATGKSLVVSTSINISDILSAK